MSAAPRTQETSLISAIAANPRDLLSYIALANFYRQNGELRKAEMTLRRLIEMEPTHLQAWIDFGTLCGHRNDWRTAVDAFERVCTLRGQDPADWIRYGSALLANRDLRNAKQVRNELLMRFPGRWEGHLLAGHLHKVHGELTEAAAAYRRALEYNPRQTDAWYNLVDLGPPAVSDSLTKQLERLRSDASLSSRDSANVLFAVARIYDHAGNVSEAMTLYHDANAAAARAMHELGVLYDPDRIAAETARVKSLFDDQAISSPLAPLDLDMRLVFITGMPRSGTTLIERVLGSHPAVTSGGEMPFMQDCLAALLESRTSAGWRGALDPFEDETHRLVLELREKYLDGVFERDLEGEYVIDKLPANFAAIGLIRILFPDALIIHCSRDPVATCWSLYTAHFGLHLPYNAALKDLAHYYGSVYSPLMQHWRGIANLEIIDVDYDCLISDPDAGIRDIIQRCGLPWNDDCLRFYENNSPVFTANTIAVRKPIFRAGAQRWRQFEEHLGPLMEALQGGGASDTNLQP